jgi:hypothetical protein
LNKSTKLRDTYKMKQQKKINLMIFYDWNDCNDLF